MKLPTLADIEKSVQWPGNCLLIAEKMLERAKSDPHGPLWNPLGRNLQGLPAQRPTGRASFNHPANRANPFAPQDTPPTNKP
jgi:hypothetical protein